jgi:hypothetical protein
MDLIKKRRFNGHGIPLNVRGPEPRFLVCGAEFTTLLRLKSARNGVDWGPNVAQMQQALKKPETPREAGRGAPPVSKPSFQG